jgi:hypothetical protein
MSLLPFDFDDVLAAFENPDPLTAFERAGSRADNGAWTTSDGQPRNVKAVVLTMKPMELELLAPGNVAGGGIVLLTTETLYIQGPTATGSESRQSFVNYHGFTWRVMGTTLTTKPNAGLNVYNCVRYLSNGNDSSNIA